MLYEASRLLYEENYVIASYGILLEADDRIRAIAKFKDLIYRSN